MDGIPTTKSWQLRIQTERGQRSLMKLGALRGKTYQGTAPRLFSSKRRRLSFGALLLSGNKRMSYFALKFSKKKPMEICGK
jgi:hypothetical protein